MRFDLEFSCPKKWAEMSGSEKQRFCSDCNQSVYNLSEYKDDEVSALVEQDGSCVSFFVNEKGEVQTKDGFDQEIQLVSILSGDDEWAVIQAAGKDKDDNSSPKEKDPGPPPLPPKIQRPPQRLAGKPAWRPGDLIPEPPPISTPEQSKPPKPESILDKIRKSLGRNKE